MNLDLIEGARAHGVYTAWTIGPKERLRKDYGKLLLEIGDLELSGRKSKAESLRVRAARMLEHKWDAKAPNIVTHVGMNLMLDNAFGTGADLAGPFLGLIADDSYTAVAIGDTMASHAGWLEAGNLQNPTWDTPAGVRGTPTFAAAANGAKAFSSAVSFTINSTGPDVVKGCFLVYGTGALTTIDNTGGVLWSAGLFTGGDKSLSDNDVLNVSYSTDLVP